MSRLASYKGLGSPINEVEFLSNASTTITLTADQQGKLLIWDGAIAQINLPAPEAGMVFRLMNSTGGITSTPTKICSSGSYDILCNNTTKKAVCCGSTEEGGIIIELFGINDFRWVASSPNPGTTAVNSTTT